METVEELLRPTQTLYLDVMCYAIMLNQQYGEGLRPPRPGLYKMGELTPCMFPGMTYYCCSANNMRSEVITTENFLAFPKLQGTIIDEQGRVVLLPYIVANKSQYVKPFPTVPVSAFFIVKSILSNYLESVIRPPTRSYASNEIYSNILPEYYGLFTDGILERMCEPLIYQISNFMGKDNWHVYYVKQQLTTVVVEKTNDYRVIEYHRRIENGDFSQ